MASLNSPNPNRAHTDSSSSVEHGDVKVVAVNDPFIEPHYAVSLPHILIFALALAIGD